VNLTEYLAQHNCERPDLRLIAEDDRFRRFFCMTCHLDWVVSRSRAKAHAREEMRLSQMRRMSEQESRRVSVSGRYYTGARND
jgi:hypothetical protein